MVSVKKCFKSGFDYVNETYSHFIILSVFKKIHSYVITIFSALTSSLDEASETAALAQLLTR